MTKKKKGNSSKKTVGLKSRIDTNIKPTDNKIPPSKEDLRFTQISIDRASDSIFWIGPDARILYANEAACRRLGYTQKQILSKKVFDIDPKFNEGNWPNQWEKVKKSKSQMVESVHLTKDGTEIPTEITVNYLEFDNKEYHIAYARPIIQRKMAENALRESETKFRMLSEQGLLAIVIIQDGYIKFANKALANLLETKVSTILNLKKDGFGNYVHPDDKKFVMDQAKKKQAGEKDVVSNYHFRMITESGQEKWIDLYSRTVTYEGKNADFVSMVDITERKMADELLRKAHNELEFLVKERTVELTESNRQLKRRIFDLYTIFELSRNFNAVLNYETLLDSFVLTSMGQMGAAKAALYLPQNAGDDHFHIARVKGSPPFPKEEIVVNLKSKFARYITSFNRPLAIEEIISRFEDSDDTSFAKYFANGLVVPLIFQAALRGILIISGKESGVRFRDEDIEFLSILANQTAVSIENARLYNSEKEAMQKLQETQKLLIRSERMAVLGELSAKVAHEVNNPLGIIKNYLQLLSRQISQNDKSEEYIAVVSQEINRIALIVKQLLSVSKSMHFKFERIDLEKLLSEVVALMKRQLDDFNITIEFATSGELPTIMAWPDGLKQVFMNLIINARDAIKSDGVIKIQASALENKVRIVVKDSGPGIKEEHITRIFEPFYTTKPAESGTGLGLSVCSSIVKKHSGIIIVCPEEKGGCFRVELPIEQEDIEYEYQI
ncbi:MAG: ATP-binding protein [Candidatus Zixiibacteriota bacterium]